MSGARGLAELTGLAWLAFAAILAGLVSVAYGRLRPRVLALPPVRRARSLLGWAAAPALGATLLTALCFVPSLGSLALGTRDHCAQHHDGHAHFCVLHLEAAEGGVAGTALLVLAGVVLAARGAPFGASVHRARRAARALLGLPRVGVDRGGAVVVACAQPLAWTAGWLRPRAYVSTGLLRALPPQAVDAVLAHEAAHVRRRDNLRKLAAACFALLLPGRTRARLLADLDLACELSCDREASAVDGGALAVADALVQVARLAQARAPAPFGSSFGEGDVAARVDALLAPTEGAAARSPWRPVWLASPLLACAAADPLHHAVETALGLLL